MIYIRQAFPEALQGCQATLAVAAAVTSMAAGLRSVCCRLAC
jgi:hypothetical protein